MSSNFKFSLDVSELNADGFQDELINLTLAMCCLTKLKVRMETHELSLVKADVSKNAVAAAESKKPVIKAAPKKASKKIVEDDEDDEPLPPEVSTKPAAKSVTKDEVIATVKRLVGTKQQGMEIARGVLKKFQVAKVAELSESQYQDFVSECELAFAA